MIIRKRPALHLTYCLNIHRGETWRENLEAIATCALRVREKVAPGKPFGLGLRLSARAAAALARRATLERFRAFLADHGLYVFTINGFPYGKFHGARVKEKVYAPDWRETARREYTDTLAHILAALLPEGCPGSISTVPGSYKPWIRSPRDADVMAANLADAAAHLARLRRERGVDIALALEPEPDCFIETAREAVAFFTGPLRIAGAARLRRAHGMGRAEARDALAAHVGVCLDTAHAAVEFEQPHAALRTLLAAGIRVPKIQLSAALRARPRDSKFVRLREFCDPVYLHQTRVRTAGGRTLAFEDLPAAIACFPGTVTNFALARPSTSARQEKGEISDCPRILPGEEWRVHFHVPLFFAGRGELSSTSDLLDDRFFREVRRARIPHLEIETYTFDVLPPRLRRRDVVDSIAREFAWVLARAGGSAEP